jgi:biotin transport system ATP-binding protein
MTAIRLDDVTVRLDGSLILDRITLAIDQPRVAVIGPNGSGKSTFARLVGGLVGATSGHLSVLGLNPARQQAELRHRVSFVFSNPDAQIVMPTVAEDVALSLRRERLPATESAARVAEALQEFGLADLANRAAHDLSGGQKQMLALCAALIRRPDLVIADEPTAFLDARNSRAIADRLLGGSHHRLVLVTHDLALAARCDTVVLFDQGLVIDAGEPADVLRQYEELLRC